MNKEDKFYINELSQIRAFCINSDKEDIYMYIHSLQQQNKKYKEVINKAIEYIYDNDLFHEEYNGGCNCYFSSDSQEKKELLDILKEVE